ncbi:MAG: hypothetical protein H6625_09695 [Bdellovibrionaceae bacterium]|nr:hypothetical protein [Pseudobdellovibrionaceae bacterium]
MLCNLDKLKLLESLENKSIRQRQKILLQMLLEIALPKEKERLLSDNHTEIRFVLNQELKNRLAELRSLLGAKGATINMVELIDYMIKISIETIKIKKFGNKRVLSEQRKVETTLEAKSKIQQDEIAPELQCSMNFKSKNNKSYTRGKEKWLNKKIYGRS